jgi:hypothetical protein
MRVEKRLKIEAPYRGASVYAQSQSYTGKNGLRLIESVKHEMRKADDGRYGLPYYHKEIYRRVSEDNGRTWRRLENFYNEDPCDLEGEHRHIPMHFLDPENGLLLGMFLTYSLNPEKKSESFSDEGLINKTKRMKHQISSDGGLTWGREKILVCDGAEYDEKHWGPGLFYGKNGCGGDLGHFIKMPDGSFISAMTVNLEDGKRFQSVFVRGRWTPDQKNVKWEFGDYISVPLGKSTQGCCEPMPALLDDGRVFVSLRCCGDRENKAFPSLKYCAISSDGAKTFSEPKPLMYDDGTPVWSPSSYAGILRSSVNGRYYWFGNILDAPTYGAYPRYPLRIAELIPEKGILIKSSVTLIDTKPADFPEEWRRYTNFGFYEDRVTKEIVLSLPEQPRVSKKDFTSDCYEYRISVG